MSFILSSGDVQSPLNNGGVAYGTGGGVKVSAAGTAGQVLTSTGAGAPTWATAASGGSQNFTANGAIAAGNLVSLTAADIVTATSGSLGAYTVTQSANSWSTTNVQDNAQIAIAYDPTNNIVVVAWSNTSTYYPNIRTGVVSGTTITWDAGITVVQSVTASGGIAATFDQTAQAFLIAYGPANTISVKAVTVTTSGTVTVGTNPVILWNSGTAWVGDITYVSNAGGTLISWAFGTSQTRSNFLTVSGTVVTNAGSPTYIISSNQPAANANKWCSLVYDSNTQKTVLFFVDTGGYINYDVITVTGTSITHTDTITTSINSVGPCIKAVFNPTNNTIILAYSASSQLYGYTVVSSLSGSTLTLQTPTQFKYTAGQTIYGVGLGFDQNTNQCIVIYYTYGSVGYTYYRNGTPTTTSVTFGAETILQNNNNYGSYYNFPIIYTNSTIKSLLVATCFSSNNSTFSDYVQFFNATVTTNYSTWIGIANSTVSTGATVGVTILGGVNSKQTGLTFNTTYYVDQFGNLTTYATGNIKVGKALSATEMYVTGTN